MLASGKRDRVPSELGAAQRFGRPEGREREAALGKALSLLRTDLHNPAHPPILPGTARSLVMSREVVLAQILNKLEAQENYASW